MGTFVASVVRNAQVVEVISKARTWDEGYTLLAALALETRQLEAKMLALEGAERPLWRRAGTQELRALFARMDYPLVWICPGGAFNMVLRLTPRPLALGRSQLPNGSPAGRGRRWRPGLLATRGALGNGVNRGGGR